MIYQPPPGLWPPKNAWFFLKIINKKQPPVRADKPAISRGVTTMRYDVFWHRSRLANQGADFVRFAEQLGVSIWHFLHRLQNVLLDWLFATSSTTRKLQVDCDDKLLSCASASARARSTRTKALIHCLQRCQAAHVDLTTNTAQKRTTPSMPRRTYYAMVPTCPTDCGNLRRVGLKSGGIVGTNAQPVISNTWVKKNSRSWHILYWLNHDVLSKITTGCIGDIIFHRSLATKFYSFG